MKCISEHLTHEGVKSHIFMFLNIGEYMYLLISSTITLVIHLIDSFAYFYVLCLVQEKFSSTNY